MGKIYKAVFTCPTYEEREVWYVSSKRAAQVMLSRQVKTKGTSQLQSKYKDVDYDMTVTPVFEEEGWSGIDPRN